MIRATRSRLTRTLFAIFAVLIAVSLIAGQTVSAAPDAPVSSGSSSSTSGPDGDESELSEPLDQESKSPNNEAGSEGNIVHGNDDSDDDQKPVATNDDGTVGAMAAILDIDKAVSQGTVTVDGGFSYIIHVACSVSGGDTACNNLTIKDTIPEGFVLDPVPASIADVRDVDYDPVTRELTVTYLEPIMGGSSGELILPIKVPATADFPDGSQVPNTAKAYADNASEVSGSVDIIVLNPAKPKVETGKSWSPTSVIAQSGDTTEVMLMPANISSTSTQVSELSVTEADPDVANAFNFGSTVTIDQWPAGADTLTVYACTIAPPAECGDDDFTTVAGAATSPASSLNLDSPSTYTGLKFAFTNSDGQFLPTDPGGADIKFDLILRDDYRDGSGSITPESDLTIHNSAVPEIVVENSGTPETVTGDEATDNMVILSDELKLESSKDYYSAQAGTYDPDPNHPAVAGENSPVAMNVEVKNTSAFPIDEITLTEPATGTLAPFVPTHFAVTLPNNADQAEVTWACSESGTPTPAAGTTYGSDQADVAVSCSAGVPVSVTITYTSSTGEILPESAGGSPAGLKLRGELDGTQVEGPIPNTVSYTGESSTKSASGEASDILEVAGRNGSGSFGKSTSGVQTIVPGQQMDFTVTFHNQGNIPLAGVVVSDPGDPTDPTNPFGALGHLDVVSASVDAAAEGNFELQVYDPDSSTWVGYATVAPIAAGDYTGVRVVSESGLLPVGGTVTLHIKVQLKDPPPADLTPIQNCATVEYEDPQNPGDTKTSSDCKNILVQGPRVGGTVAKHIVPATAVRPEPGIPAKPVQVRIPVSSQNQSMDDSSTIYLKQLYAMDVDKEFFDAVDFDENLYVNRPPGATHTKVDLCLWGTDCDDNPIA